MYMRKGIYTCGHAWKEEERGGLYYIICCCEILKLSYVQFHKIFKWEEMFSWRLCGTCNLGGIFHKNFT